MTHVDSTLLFTFQLMSRVSDEDENPAEMLDLTRKLYDRCNSILQDCETRAKEQPIEGLHRYTYSLKAELSFLGKVRKE